MKLDSRNKLAFFALLEVVRLLKNLYIIPGSFGINIHKAGKDSKDVDQWSAGCQVFQKSDDFNEFMGLARKHKNLYGNKFTYTLIDERAYNRKLKRYGAYAIGIGLLALIIYKIKK